jgi:biopolymer transport protein TolR
MAMMRGNGRSRLVSEINVTPLVDVMLVLLIIFMVTAPMMTQGVDVDLPQTTTQPLRQQEEPMIVTINGQGEIFLNKIQCSQAVLKQQLTAKSAEEQTRPIYLQADRKVPYGVVVSVMADIKEAGFNKLGMVTRPPEERR